MPTFVEPVKETPAMRGSSTSAVPTAAPPWTRLTTSGGTPASRKISTTRDAVAGVSGEGLNTTGSPQTRAGAIFQQGMATGKFQGVSSATGPMGWRRV